jgi:phenylacetate-CoA ligase
MRLDRLVSETRATYSIGRSFAAYGALAGRSRWTADRLATYQNVQLLKLLGNSSRASPFIQARRPNRALDLQAWPLTSRAEVQNESVERLLAPGFTPASCTALATTGSSGQPLRVYFSDRDLRRRWLYFVRMFRAYDLPFLCRLVQMENYKQSRVQRAGESRGWDRRSFISVREPVDRRLDLLLDADPQAIIGFSADLVEMGQRARERGIVFPALRVVMGVGDVMTQDHRAAISKGFGAVVRDFYGAVEAGLVAFECPAGTGAYHVNADNLVVEIIDGGRQASTGEVVITPLAYDAMPFIR